MENFKKINYVSGDGGGYFEIEYNGEIIEIPYPVMMIILDNEDTIRELDSM